MMTKFDNRQLQMNTQILTDTAKAMVADDKGLLAMDESNPTCNKRFAKLGIPQTVEARRDYRELIVTNHDDGAGLVAGGAGYWPGHGHSTAVCLVTVRFPAKKRVPSPVQPFRKLKGWNSRLWENPHMQISNWMGNNGEARFPKKGSFLTA
jgi:hypothetical protein